MTSFEPNLSGVIPTQGQYVVRRLANSPQAAKFISSTEDNGGATMDLTTNKLYGENGPEEAESVGAERSIKTGKPVATHIYPNQTTLSGEQFANEYLRLKGHVAPGASMGSWQNPDTGNVEVDASRVYSDPLKASEAVVARNQNASFDFRNFSDVTYKEHAKRIGSKKRQRKQDKNEVTITPDVSPSSREFLDK